MSNTAYLEKLLEKYNSGFRQSDECTCGPASAALVSFALDGKERSESQWLDPKFKRWVPVNEFTTRGIGLVELLFTSELVLGVDYEVSLRRAYPENLDQFRRDLLELSKEKIAIIANFRQDDLLKEERDSHKNPHFSPIASFDEGKDTVLVADVDSEVSRAYTVSVEDIFQSMKAINPVFDLPRGWLVIRRRKL